MSFESNLKIKNTNVKSCLASMNSKMNLKKIRLRWFGHLMRITEERITKKILHTKTESKRPRKRPRTRRIDKIRNNIDIRGQNRKK